MRKYIILIISCIFLIAAAAAGFYAAGKGAASGGENVNRVVVVSPHPVDFMKPLINEFETETGIRVDVLQCGTSKAIEMIKKGGNVDVLWGGSILSVGSDKDLFLPYETDNQYTFYDEFKNVGEGMTCFTDVPSVLMVNTDLVGDDEIKGYADLLKSEFRGKIAYADPGKSSSSFEHLTNMLYAMGGGNPENGWDYVGKLIGQLDGKLLDSSSEVYRGVATGKYVVGLTFEEAAITMLKNGYHVKIVYMDEGVVSNPDGIYINKNAKNTDNAKIFADFMTDVDTQQFITRDLGRRSVRKDVEISKLVTSKESINILPVDKDMVIEKNKEWTEKFAVLYGEDKDE